MRYAFGDCVLDEDTRQLLRAGRELSVSPKAFELLGLLLRSRPRAVSRTRLTAALWPDTHVGPTSLHVLVSQVRAALGDDASAPRWIRTVPRFGYAFVGPASDGSAVHAEAWPSPVAVAARLVFERDEHSLGEGVSVMGREPGVEVRVDAPGVSRRHARIVVRGAEATIEDLGSKNGTFVQGERVSEPCVLHDGDVVQLGRRVRFLFARPGDRRTETEAP